MNFKENYQQEMSEIEKPSGITEKLLNAADMEQETYADKKNRSVRESSTIWKTAAATIAIVCMLGLCLQHEKVIGFAQSVLNTFTVLVNNEDKEFGMIEPVKMNIDGFINDEKTENIGGPDPSYSQHFTSYQEMNQLTQLELPCADKVEYKETWVEIEPEYKVGHLGANFLYKGASYYMNGMFTLDGFDQKDWGYGTKGSKEVYQYGNGKKACFTKNSDGYEVVYFREGKILFQLPLGNATSTKKKQVKDLLDLFGREG